MIFFIKKTKNEIRLKVTFIEVGATPKVLYIQNLKVSNSLKCRNFMKDMLLIWIRW